MPTRDSLPCGLGLRDSRNLPLETPCDTTGTGGGGKSSRLGTQNLGDFDISDKTLGMREGWSLMLRTSQFTLSLGPVHLSWLSQGPDSPALQYPA